jgi:hypothetical protein
MHMQGRGGEGRGVVCCLAFVGDVGKRKVRSKCSQNHKNRKKEKKMWNDNARKRKLFV